MDDFQASLKQYIEDYFDEIRDGMDEIAKKRGKQGVKMLRRDSPQLTGKYAKGWHILKTRNGYFIKNKEYRLTHLLEKGHLKADGVGVVPPFKHIEPVEKRVVRDYMNDVVELVTKWN